MPLPPPPSRGSRHSRWLLAATSLRRVVSRSMNESPSMRTSALSLAWTVGFSIFWCGGLIWATVREWPVSPTLLLVRALGVMLVVLAAYRMVRVGFEVQGDELLVRNLFRTRHVARSHLRRVWLGEPLTAPLPGGWLAGPRGEAINVETEDSRFTVDVTRNWLGTRGLHAQSVAATQSLLAWQQGVP